MKLWRDNTHQYTGTLGFLMTLYGALVAICLSASPLPADGAQADVLSIGGSVTEIVYALDKGRRLVARDSTSIYPQAANGLPDVGYMRALSPEGVLAVAPALILSEEGAGPPETIAALQAAAIPFITIPDAYDAEGVIAKVLAVGEALGAQEQATVLARDVATQFETLSERIKPQSTPKKVMFILSTSGGRILASGTNTAADGIIALAGGKNAMLGFEGYKSVTDEAVVAAAPDVILMMDRTGDHATSNAALFAMPALAPTPAAANQAIVRMNGLYLLGFGPRTAQATLDLNEALYGR
jgi:iron complex transport system substrate-binding protein